jgi:DNA-binding transcriptional LysR family regulator
MFMKHEMMSLTGLKYFCDAIRLGGLSLAAKENFVTQSAISQSISKLEKFLGVPLLIHHPNRLQLTPQGEVAFQEAQTILQMIKQFHINLLQDQSAIMESLQFACTHSFALAVIPPYIKRFQQEHPKAQVNFQIKELASIIEQVKSGIIDFGILPSEICQDEQCELYEEDLGKFQKKIIYSGGFSFYASSLLRRNEQKQLGLILSSSQQTENRRLHDLYFKKYKTKLPLALEVNNLELAANLAAEGAGLAYLPDYLGLLHKNRLEVCDLGLQKQEYHMSAIFLKEDLLHQSSKVFLSYFG